LFLPDGGRIISERRDVKVVEQCELLHGSHEEAVGPMMDASEQLVWPGDDPTEEHILPHELPQDDGPVSDSGPSNMTGEQPVTADDSESLQGRRSTRVRPPMQRFDPTPQTHAEQRAAQLGESTGCLDPLTYACTADVPAETLEHKQRTASTAILTAEAPEHNQSAASPYSKESCVALDAHAVQRQTCLSAAESFNPPLCPHTVREALSQPDALEWQKAIDDEILACLAHQVWEPCTLPQGKRALPTRFVLERKRDGRYKARLVAGGHRQQQGIDFQETFAHVCSYRTLRMLRAASAHEGLVLRQFDIRAAFLNGVLEEEVYMRPPVGAEHLTEGYCGCEELCTS
jgi:hypothetical protein